MRWMRFFLLNLRESEKIINRPSRINFVHELFLEDFLLIMSVTKNYVGDSAIQFSTKSILGAVAHSLWSSQKPPASKIPQAIRSV